MSIHDKNGREIERGDVVKVFHFVGRRNKRHFMYKQAIGLKTMRDGTKYMMFNHLDMNDKYYVEPFDDRWLADYEIVQSIDAKFEDRPRLSAPLASEDRQEG